MTKDEMISPAQPLEPTRPTKDVVEAAALLGLSPWLVLQAIGQGKLLHKRVGRRIVIPAGAVHGPARRDRWPGDPRDVCDVHIQCLTA